MKGWYPECIKKTLEIQFKKKENQTTHFKKISKKLMKHFIQEDIQMANKHTQSNAQSLRKCKIKPQCDHTVYLDGEWGSREKQSCQYKVLLRMWNIWNSMHCWWECKMVPPFWKIVWHFLIKLNHTLTIPLTLFWSIYPSENMFTQKLIYVNAYNGSDL